MKFLVIFALAIASAVALPEPELTHRSVEVPVFDIGGRITNGNTAAVGQFPYQVGLSLKISTFQSSWCGGSLIGNEWVLTAAHCTDGVASVTVYLGATARTSAELKQTVTKDNIIIHSGWNTKTLRNDISLIKISAVSFTPKIQPVRLPTINANSTYDGDFVIASGWGRTSDDSNAVATNLMWSRFQVITNSVCAKTFGSSFIISSNICVSTQCGTSTCQGDSGGPLVLESSKVQVGLTSFGAAAGCEKGYPVAFTRVTSYLDWIKSHTGISY